MSNATDNLIETEKLIRTTFSKADVQERSLQICRWLLGFNSIENGFKIKCYCAPVNQICFCVDRGRDCEAKRVQTWFLRLVTSNLRLTLRPITIESNAPYIKIQIKKRNNSSISYAVIQPPEGITVNFEILKKHIIESYKMKLYELGLLSKVSIIDNAPQQSCSQTQVGSHLPTKEDFESAYRALAHPGDTISIDSVLNQMESNSKKGLLFKNDWRMITEKNIENWSKKQ